MATEPQGNAGKPMFGPSDRLIAMFRACSRDPTQAINERLRHMLHTFLQHSRDNAGNTKTKELAAKCCCEAEIWYYRILENLVSEERKKLGTSHIPGLLESSLAQRCLVTCCLEIAICSNSLPRDFLLLLQIFRLAPYHVWRMIELVLQAEVSLPCAVVRHLIQVDKKVLESLAWTSDSPLWEEIRANEGHLPACEQVMPPEQLEDPKRSELQPEDQAAQVILGAGLSATTDQQCPPSALNRPRKSSSLHLFARKVYSLMGKRLRDLCSTLGISEELRLKIWTCFEHSLIHCTFLMEGRHLDQLLMCAIYITAKITKMEIPFKHIMNCYKSQPHANKSVCKNVLISGRRDNNSPTKESYTGDHSDSVLTPSTPSTHYPGQCQQERGNLIYFYNQIYTTKMQCFAKQFALTFGGETPPLSPYPRQGKASPRGYRLSSSPSIFISLHNAETAPLHTTGLCYYFNSSPSERLREINNMIKTGRSPNRLSNVTSLDEEEAMGEDGPSAKKLRLDDVSAWQRRLRNVVNDRATRRVDDQATSATKR